MVGNEERRKPQRSDWAAVWLEQVQVGANLGFSLDPDTTQLLETGYYVHYGTDLNYLYINNNISKTKEGGERREKVDGLRGADSTSHYPIVMIRLNDSRYD